MLALQHAVFTRRVSRVARRARLSAAAASFFSSSSSSMPGMVVFNREHKLRQRNRAASREDFDRFSYIRDHLAEQVVDRLQDIMRSFPVAVDVGCGAGHILKHLPTVGGAKVGKLIQVDSSAKMLERSFIHREVAADAGIESYVVHADEEFLPFADNSVDLVVSCMSLHWTNDLPGTLIQINRMLKPDGVFLGVMLGGETLNEVRSSFVLAEQERSGGISQHTSPVAQVGDVGSLLLNAGFKLPTVDTDVFHINYDDSVEVMEHLQGMGDSNACIGRLGYVGQDTLLAAAAVYQHAYGSEWASDYEQNQSGSGGGGSVDQDESSSFDYPEEDDPEFEDDDALSGDGLEDASGLGNDGGGDSSNDPPEKVVSHVVDETEKAVPSIPCTFQSIHMIGWKHHESQQVPLERGSAARSFKELASVSSDDVRP